MHLSKSVRFFYELKHFCLILEFIKNCSVSSKEKGAATLNVGNRLQKVPMQCLDLGFLKNFRAILQNIRILGWLSQLSSQALTLIIDLSSSQNSRAGILLTFLRLMPNFDESRNYL